ncbi:Uncharacterised protein [Mycobacteroides abscessus subsp. massiliense]|nr:Uncharacterised protein [Mycobacteroides abscessus subsp. massiliense]
MGTQIRGRHNGRSHRRGSQIDGPDARFLIAWRGGLVHVGGRCLEDQIRLLVLPKQPVHTLVRGFQTETAGTLETFGLGIDADHPPRLQPLGTLQFVQQVGADVSRTDDRYRCL